MIPSANVEGQLLNLEIVLCGTYREPYHGSLKTAYKLFDEPPRVSYHVYTVMSCILFLLNYSLQAVEHRPVRHVRSAPVVGAGSWHLSAAGRIDVNQSLPGRMERLAIRNHKEPQHIRDNMNDGSPSFEAKSMKVLENLANNQKLLSSSVPVASQQRYSSNVQLVLLCHCRLMEFVSTSELPECKLCCEKAADIEVLPCKHIVYCHPCRESVRAIKKCMECRVSSLANKLRC